MISWLFSLLVVFNFVNTPSNVAEAETTSVVTTKEKVIIEDYAIK